MSQLQLPFYPSFTKEEVTTAYRFAIQIKDEVLLKAMGQALLDIHEAGTGLEDDILVPVELPKHATQFMTALTNQD